MNRFTESFKEFFAPLSAAQRTMFFGLTITIIAVVGMLFYWALSPNYTLLFGSLKNEAAQELIQELDNRGVDYQLKNGGQSIYVQSDKVNELRIQLAPMGAPQSGMKGYELFDTNSLGMTDFMQQINNKRALEGELAKSVNSLEQVESSRIHLVLPERTPFKETTVEASASVIVTLKQGRELNKNHVTGISSLIAGSVEGLDASNITVIDQVGNRLTGGIDEDSEFASGGSQMKLRKKTESYLTSRGQTMLDRVLGPGNSILRVSVDQDFDSIVRTTNKIDPDSRTLISEQRSEEIHNTEGREMVPIDEFTPIVDRGETVVVSNDDNEISSRTRNYEINKTEEVFRKAQGDITRISASVLINHKQSMQQNDQGEQVMVNEPYPEEKIEEFREVVSSALGIKQDRGDQLTIKQVSFWDPTERGPQGNMLDKPTPWNDIFKWSLVALAFFAIVALIYSIRRQFRGPGSDVALGFPGAAAEEVFWTEDDEKQISGDMSEEELPRGPGSKLDGELRKQLEERKFALAEIKDFVEMKPTEAAQVVRAMLISDN